MLRAGTIVAAGVPGALLAPATSLSSIGVRPLTFSVLRSLSDGEFHSGQALAQRYAVSRASIWNALNDALELGVYVQRVHGRGYRLAEPLDWLDAGRIRQALEPVGLRIEVVDHCGSTNVELLQAAERGEASGLVLATELQTAGRGRLGRSWQSGLASALTFSLLWRFERPASGLGGLSLAVGAAVARALRGFGTEVGLKWPNDLLWRERKLGGILIEIRGDALGPCAVVIGIGLNVRLSAAERRGIEQPVADLVEAGAAGVGRSELLAGILREQARALDEFAERGFDASRDEWIAHHAHQGRRITLIGVDGSRVTGIAAGIDDSGRLLVDTREGRRVFLSGDVSLRTGHVPRD